MIGHECLSRLAQNQNVVNWAALAAIFVNAAMRLDDIRMVPVENVNALPNAKAKQIKNASALTT